MLLAEVLPLRATPPNPKSRLRDRTTGHEPREGRDRPDPSRVGRTWMNLLRPRRGVHLESGDSVARSPSSVQLGVSLGPLERRAGRGMYFRDGEIGPPSLGQ